MWKDKKFEVRIESELLKIVKRIAKKNKMSTSEFIRRAIEKHLAIDKVI